MTDHVMTAEEMEAAEVQAAMDENVRLGFFEECGTNERGETLYRITPAGTRHVEEMIARAAKDGGNDGRP